MVVLDYGEYGGTVTATGNGGMSKASLGFLDSGGIVSFYGKGQGSAMMGVIEYGNGAISTWDKDDYNQWLLHEGAGHIGSLPAYADWKKGDVLMNELIQGKFSNVRMQLDRLTPCINDERRNMKESIDLLFNHAECLEQHKRKGHKRINLNKNGIDVPINLPLENVIERMLIPRQMQQSAKNPIWQEVTNAFRDLIKALEVHYNLHLFDISWLM